MLSFNPVGHQRKRIARNYLKGRGIEIGALNKPLQTPPRAHVTYVDRMSNSELLEHYPDLRGTRLVDIDIVDDGERLRKIADCSQDFVIANHFLEHCQNPFLAIINMVRVLREGGILYLAIPDKRFNDIDRGRAATTIVHVSNDYSNGPEGSRLEHFREWVRNTNRDISEQDVASEAARLMEIDYSIHYHAWTLEGFSELVFHVRRAFNVPVDTLLISRNVDEAIVVLQKNTHGNLDNLETDVHFPFYSQLRKAKRLIKKLFHLP